jgi:peptide/nickel transport system ATP-binding protein
MADGSASVREAGVMAAPLLEVRELRTHFHTEAGLFKAVDGVSFTIGRGKTVGLVGESGCGKSVTSLSLMGLVPQPPGEVLAEGVVFDGRDLLKLSEADRRKVRGGEMAMIFQEPMTSLNPVYTVGDQIIEAVLAHRPMSRAAARERAIQMLRLVRIPTPERRVDDYPHQMSGGMRQRVMIAMALACDPKLLIADEPTTALDVTIQAQILDLLRELRDRTGASILLITHDLGVIAEMADTVVVMYAGRIVETADVKALFADPQHPYTIGLLGSIPRISEERERLATIEGMVPTPHAMPAGCRFNPRCPFAIDICREKEPPLGELTPGHYARCHRAPLELKVARAAA